MPKYLSGRSKRTQQSALKPDINRYLSIGDAEPNLRDPIAPGDTPPFGQQYQIVSVEGFPGQRFWRPVGGGVIPGSISVYDENSANLVGGPSSTTQLIFKGAAIRAEGVGNGSPSNPYGVGVTITVFSPGNEQEILFNTANEFSTSSKLKFDTSNGLLSAGDRINVGLGGTVIATTGIGSVGIGTSNPTQKLDLNGDLRLRGTIYDYTNQPGTTSQILIKNNLGGIIWVNQSTIRAGAGGTYQNVQFHNSSGLVDGAPNFVYDEINNRIGIGSTTPRTTLDVLGISSFRGGSFIDSLTVTGVTTTSTLAVSGTSTTRNLVVTGVTTLGFLTGTSAFFTGIVTATKFSGAIDVTNLFVSGISTFKQKVNIDSDLGVTGLTTTRDLQVYQSTTLNRLRVTGISTFDSQVIINNNLNVTGVGTIGSIKLESNTVRSISGNLVLQSSGGTTQINDAVYLTNTTNSTSKDTGALIVEGGVGIEKDVYVGGDIYGNGIIVGTATSSNTIRTLGISSNALFYPTFVDSNNVSAAYESVYTSGGLVYNPSTGNLGIGTTNATQKLSVYGVIESLNDGANEGGNLVLRGQPGTPSRWNIDNHTSFAGGVINQFRIFREDEQTGLNGKTYLGISTVGEVIIGNGPIGIHLTPTGTSNQQLQVQSGAYVSGNLGIGTTNPGEKLQVDGNIRVGISTTSNYIAFRGTFNDDQVPYRNTYIGERLYKPLEPGGAESSELLLFKGNDVTASGPDRIRLSAAEIRFDTYSVITGGGLFEEAATYGTNRVIITETGNVGIGSAIPTSKLQVAGDVTPSVNNAYDLGSASLRWRNVFATTFNGAFQGNADTATKLLTTRNIAITGDLSWNVNFDGSANVTSTGTLASTGVVANTYGSSTQVPVFAVDSKGRITSVSNTGINFSTATVLNSDNVKTVTNSTNGTFYPTFVDSDNSPAAYEAVYTDAGISYNPSTNLLTSGSLNLSNATASTITSVLSRGADNNFQLSAQNGPATNASGQEVSRFGINYSGSGWNSYFKFIRGGGTADGSITIATNNTDRVQINSIGNVLPQGTSGTLDLGGASNRWGTVYANTFNGLNNITTVDLQTGNLLVTGIATVNGFFRPSVGSGADKGIYWQPDPAGGAGDEAFIRYYAESGEDTILHIGIRNDGVVGNSDNIYLEAAGGVNVSTSLSAPQLINTGFDFVLGNGDQSTRGNSGNSRALVKSSGSTLTLNYGGDFTGGIVAGSTLYPTTNGTLNLGGTSNYWNNVYANNFVGAVTGTATNATTALYLNTAQSSSDRDDITTRLNSGFWQTSSATTAEGWPTTTNGWYHLISSTHSNEANYYALQLAAPFFSQNLYYRSTNASGATAWTEVITAANITSNPSFSALQTTANNAGSAAAAAQGTANTALTNANNAQTTANTALTNANNAQTTANTALTTANTALSNSGNVTVNQTGYLCTNPITTSGSTITIASNSNAYGTKYVQGTAPASPCEGDIWYDTRGGGRIIQVTNTVVSTAPHYTTTSGNLVPTGFSASITPTSSASRIIVMINGSVYNANAGYGVVWGVYCNGAIITPAIYGTFDSAGANLASAALTLTHSPGTTATCTYEVYIAVTAGGTAYWFGSGYGSFITLMEVLT